MKRKHYLKPQKEHLNLLETINLRKKIELSRSEGIDYLWFTWEGKKVLYFEGSNEAKDWIYNFMNRGFLFHRGYRILARRWKRIWHTDEDFILVGHSHGGGVASILHKYFRKQIIYSVILGSPASYTWLNPFVPKKMFYYKIKDDITRISWMLFPLLRHCKRAIILIGKGLDKPKVGKKIISNHVFPEYIGALQNYFNGEKDDKRV